MSDLDQARAAVARDLHDPSYDDVVDRCVKHRRWWVEQWAAGEPFLLCLLAQDVQEAVAARDPMWPRCPEHGDHRLVVEPDLGPDPFWVCERSGLPVAQVGLLRP
ncbi:MAG: hypothetical protein ACR2FG_08580 [Marmoricola sp.]